MQQKSILKTGIAAALMLAFLSPKLRVFVDFIAQNLFPL